MTLYGLKSKAVVMIHELMMASIRVMITIVLQVYMISTSLRIALC